MTRKKETEASKATRAASWKRTQERKAERRDAQNAAAARNRNLKTKGEMTPWEKAKAAARARKSGTSTQEKAVTLK